MIAKLGYQQLLCNCQNQLYLYPLMLTANNIYKSYSNLKVLKGIEVEIKQGEIVSIVGASGAGKSTLLHILGTLDRPDSGEVHLKGENLFTMSEDKLAKFRNEQIGFVFQFHNLLPEFTALENVCIPGFIKGVEHKELKTKALNLLALLNVDQRSENKPSQLSGGEQQRVAVARALINDPAVIFADEPSGNLDSKNADELHSLFFKLRDSLNQTFVLVTHNPQLAKMADKKLVIKDGIIQA